MTKNPNIDLIADDEIFETVIIYDEIYPNYLISNYGRVYSYNVDRIIYSKTDNYGYIRFELHKDGQTKYISGHRLVAFSFVENSQPDKFNTVNHIDENPSNNKWTNLEWCDDKWNLNWGNAQAKRALKRSKAVRVFTEETREFVGEFESMPKAAQACNTNAQTVCIGCKTGVPKKGYLFEYAS